MILRPPRSTRTDTLFPYTTLFRSLLLPVSLAIGSLTKQREEIGVRVNLSAACPHGRRRVGRLSLSQSCSMVAAALAEVRSEEHTSELQSLMRISYAVFCLKKKI